MLWTKDFQVEHELPKSIRVIDRSNGKDTTTACNQAFAQLIEKAIESKAFNVLSKPLQEDYKILGAKYPRVQLRRSAAGLFGVACRGAHMTAFVRTDEGMKIWVSRRSEHLFTYPGMLDTTVAGGVKAEQSPFECIVQEAEEEASLPKDYVRTHACASGVITYVSKRGEKKSGSDSGLMVPDCIYVYDIELPANMIPKPNDDEVQGFYLMDLDKIKASMLNEEFKPNCASVMIDFFIRHGIITDENEPDYIEIMSHLHRPLPVPTSPSAPRYQTV
jgi:8-oxo-dGTP pyrophosphatase MutT (NUDIX family)